MTRRSDVEVLIVGGGLVGSVWACLLARRGHKVRVFEKRPDPRRVPLPSGRSAHLVISERGWKALRAIGVEETIRKVSLPLEGRQVHAPGGRLDFVAYGKDQFIWAVNRNQLNLALVEHAAAQPNVRIEFSRTCEAVDLDANVVRFRNEDTGDREEVEAGLIFGADGAFSKVRGALMRRDRFDYSQSYFRFGLKELGMPKEAVNGSLAMDRMHVWPRRQLMLSAFPNLDGSFTAMILMPFEAPAEPRRAADPYAFSSITRPDQLRALFEAAFPDALPLMPDLTEEYFSRPAASIVTIRCSPWTFGGRVALIGDAAHAMAPFFGQGMNCGLEDCTTLDALVGRHGEDWSKVFSEYELLRKRNADAVTEMSDANFIELSEKVGDPKFLLQKKIEQVIQRLHPDRFMPQYPMVAFTHMPYERILRRVAMQGAIVQRVMSVPDIERGWDTPEVEALVTRLVLGLGRQGGDPEPLPPLDFSEAQVSPQG